MFNTISKPVALLVCLILVIGVQAKKSSDEEKPAWTKKKLSDYNDADMERLLDQWNVSRQQQEFVFTT